MMISLSLAPLLRVFERLGINYFIGGSVASSARGLPRTTLDVDLVANLSPDHAEFRASIKIRDSLTTTLRDERESARY